MTHCLHSPLLKVMTDKPAFNSSERKLICRSLRSYARDLALALKHAQSLSIGDPRHACHASRARSPSIA